MRHSENEDQYLELRLVTLGHNFCVKFPIRFRPLTRHGEHKD